MTGAPDSLELDRHFPRYTDFEPQVPVWRVSPDRVPAIHRFFDTSPISPSGRYLGLTQFSYEDSVPQPGDVADILVVDLVDGSSRIVSRTRAWDTQLGAQVQWGADDHILLFNDLDVTDWRPYGVRLDPETGDRQQLEQTIYMSDETGSVAYSPCLQRIGLTQVGYGVWVPDVPRNHGAPDDDGVWVTEVATGKTRLLASLDHLVSELELPVDGDRNYYVFHVKPAPRTGRVMAVLRTVPSSDAPRRRCLATMNADGSDIRMAITEEQWALGGHHPQWCPDGETVLMNLRLDGQHMRFVTVGHDGQNLKPILADHVGSGHPSFDPTGRYLVTDAYLHEDLAFGDGTVPIRLIDRQTGIERQIIRIDCRPAVAGPEKMWRIDPHPVWDRTGRFITFNGSVDGSRGVFIADLQGMCARS